jgi:uncharacterized protein YutE (UPF0331/DUF86 family)
MNERVVELIKQSGTDVSGKWMSMYQVEKFAKLIVQECVDICQDTDGEEDAMALCGRLDCAVEIREHFGIEE